MDTYFWIVCPGFQPNKLLVGYMYISVTVNSDTECQRFNFYLQILKGPEDSQVCCWYVLY